MGSNAGKPVAVTGRVRAGGTMVRPGGDERCVVATTWSSDRTFPRTAGEAVPFELETASGESFSVDPRQAAVSVAVRSRLTVGPELVRREIAWIAPGEEVLVEGTVQQTRNGSPARIVATRIVACVTGGTRTPPHLLPPRTLAPGAIEQEADQPVPAPEPVPVEAAPPEGADPQPPPPGTPSRGRRRKPGA